MNQTIFPTVSLRKKIFGYLFHPNSIAVIGASNDCLKPGGRVMKNILQRGFNGRLWPVNPKTETIMGIQASACVKNLPGPPDLAIVAIPSSFVLSTIEDLAGIGTGAVIILTAGFGEKDEAGRRIEQKMVNIASDAGMALIGPNCSGFLTKSYNGKFAGIVPPLSKGMVDFISGSGATVDYVMEMGITRGLTFGDVVNLGNSIQLGVEDLLELYNENFNLETKKILMLYMESVNKPAKLLRHARELAQKGCTVVGIKSGATDAGGRAAASHTGAIATSDTAVDTLFKKAGIIRVKSRSQMVDVACVLVAAGGRLSGNRICVLTDAGGPGVMMADEIDSNGMQLARLSEATRRQLAEILPRESSLANPIDMLPSRNAGQIKSIFKILGHEEAKNIDTIAVLLGDSGMSPNSDIYHQVARAMDDCPIPVIPVLSSLSSCRKEITVLTEKGKTHIPDEVCLARALSKSGPCKLGLDKSPPLKSYDKSAIASSLKNQTGPLDPDVVSNVLKGCGFRLPDQFEVYHPDQLEPVLNTIKVPSVMKVIGPLHKSDIGGVIPGIKTISDARKAWDRLLVIPGSKGVLLQSMVSGGEIIAGASREGNFGHLVMFGLGGIFVEAFKDVKFSLAPLSPAESMDMIEGIKGVDVLKGTRGEAGMDIQVISNYLQRLGQLVTDFPEIKEIDLNPIKGAGKSLYVVDARIII